MLTNKQLTELLKVPEIPKQKYRNHTRGDIESPAQAAHRNTIRMKIHLDLFKGNRFNYRAKEDGKN